MPVPHAIDKRWTYILWNLDFISANGLNRLFRDFSVSLGGKHPISKVMVLPTVPDSAPRWRLGVVSAASWWKGNTGALRHRASSMLASEATPLIYLVADWPAGACIWSVQPWNLRSAVCVSLFLCLCLGEVWVLPGWLRPTSSRPLWSLAVNPFSFSPNGLLPLQPSVQNHMVLLRRAL